ncbi:sugar ABC transporter ATP-binding protein [Cryptosporangium sp. NPDC048952]|uniref:sugar ABC transporter ATP-binding protein n=1 Tax=Cryptosporangium sp. NPDC048952 TaxID=3363961 RepID=UPI0037207B69
MLLATDLTKRYGGVTALAGAGLRLVPGEVHALLGENGAGKSTLVKVLAGAVTPDTGQVTIGDSPVRLAGPGDARRHGIAVVSQELSLFPDLDLLENLFVADFPARAGLADRSEMARRARPLLVELGLGHIPLRTPVGELDLARRQLLEICRALLGNPGVVILDEPTSALAAAAVERLHAVIRRITGRGVAVLYVSHFLEEVAALADRVTILRDGRNVVSEVPAGELTVAEMVTAMLGEAPLAEHRARAATAVVAGDQVGLADLTGASPYATPSGPVRAISRDSPGAADPVASAGAAGPMAAAAPVEAAPGVVAPGVVAPGVVAPGEAAPGVAASPEVVAPGVAASPQVVVAVGDAAAVEAAPGVVASPEVVVAVGDAAAGGAAVAGASASSGARGGRVGVRLEGVSVARRLEEVSLSARVGEVVGLAGLQGAGHLAVFEVLWGLVAPTAGTVRLPDGGERPRTTAEAVRRRVAFVPSDRKGLGLTLDQTVAENITCVSWLARRHGGFFLRPGRTREIARRHIAELRIKADPDDPVARLSGGNQQKVAFAKWIAAEPDVVLLDDPTRGVDVGVKAEMHAIVRRLAGEGKVVLMCSTDLAELAEVCDRVVVFHRGRVREELLAESLTEHTLLHAINAGT